MYSVLVHSFFAHSNADTQNVFHALLSHEYSFLSGSRQSEYGHSFKLEHKLFALSQSVAQLRYWDIHNDDVEL